jgi:UDP-glucose 4-epimerase
MIGGEHALLVDGSRVVVVGGASLVGSHTVRELLSRGAREVVVFDNLSLAREQDAAALSAVEGVRTVRGDVLSLPALRDATKDTDAVIALAALMTLSIANDPWHGVEVNVRGVHNLLDACCDNGVRKLVFASSNAVYGYGPGLGGDLAEAAPFHSSGAAAASVLYGATKIVGEQLCRLAYQRQALDYVALRYSTVFGEGQHNRAANALLILETIERISRGEAPVIVGDGTDYKHFVYAGDVARANVLALEADATDVTLNVSGPRSITTQELVELVCSVMGYRGEIRYEKPAAGVVRLTAGGAFSFDHRLAEDVIGWTPEVDIREGIERLVAWQQRPATS